jgi:hypothetical protein
MPYTTTDTYWYGGWEFACTYQEPEAAFQLQVVTDNNTVRLARNGDNPTDIFPISPDEALTICWNDTDHTVFSTPDPAVLSSQELAALRDICGNGRVLESFAASGAGADTPLTPDDLALWDVVTTSDTQTTRLRHRLHTVADNHFTSRAAATRPILEQRGRLWRCVNELVVVRDDTREQHTNAADSTAEIRRATVDAVTVIDTAAGRDVQFADSADPHTWFDRLEREFATRRHTITGFHQFRTAWETFDNADNIVIATSNYQGRLVLRCWPHQSRGRHIAAIAPRHILTDNILCDRHTVWSATPAGTHPQLSLIAELCANNQPTNNSDFELILATAATLTPAASEPAGS